MRGHQAIDISGQRFGYLTVIDRAESVGSDRGLRWNCLCDCGKQVIVPSARLRQGKTKSCGCMQKQIIAEKMTKHGMRDTRLYRIWCGMKARCTNPHVKDFRNYGGRGVSVCSEWLEQFDQFADWALEHGYDDSSDYEGENKTKYEEGYAEGYEDGYSKGLSDYEEEQHQQKKEKERLQGLFGHKDWQTDRTPVYRAMGSLTTDCTE